MTYRKDYEMEVNRESKVVVPLMYKVIMRLATLDRDATITALRANLCELMQYAINVNRNINNMHTYFNQNYAQLKAWEQSADNVYTIFFKAYLQGIPDATFHNFMNRLQDDWMDQTGDTKDAKHDNIMRKAKQNMTCS